MGDELETEIARWTNDVHVGDAAESLGEMPESSVHMAMTSPPYWNLRDYGHADQLGLEETPEEYVKNIADVLDGVKRVLREDGSLWLNLGDTYDDKDLQQIPARVALELQSRGWILRNRVTWAKPNPMPQSVKDRLNDTTEAIFHLTPSRDYWYDLDAIREPYSEVSRRQIASDYSRNKSHKWGESPGNHEDGGMHDSDKELSEMYHSEGKNPGDVFEVTTKPFPDAHFAVYPPELCKKPIKATAPPKVCAACGTPYERDVERKDDYQTARPGHDKFESERNDTNRRGPGTTFSNNPRKRKRPEREFNGWTKPCDCDTHETEPGIVLDPFAGAGTTCMVAKDLGRRFIGVDLNADYVAMAQKRVGVTVDEPERLLEDGETSLDAFADGGGRVD